VGIRRPAAKAVVNIGFPKYMVVESYIASKVLTTILL